VAGPAGRLGLKAAMKQDPLQRNGKWSTFANEVHVNAVVHTPASLMQLVDYVDLLQPDRRVHIGWTVAPDRFNRGVGKLLDQLEVPVVPWEEACERPCDLAIATSLHLVGNLPAKHRFAAPHGCGYGKNYPGWSWPPGEEPPVYGLDRQSLLDKDGKPIFSGIVLSHEDQYEVLLRQCPEAAHAALVAGDIAFDRLVVASKPFRESYRLAFGIRRRQTLVAVASTWGSESLLAKFPDLPERLLRELPADHRAVMTMHPAAWFEHGPRQVREYLRPATDAGLDLIGPAKDWRALLAAADVIVADHTSLASYAAAAGVPVLLSHYAKDDIAAGSVTAALAQVAPLYDPAKPLTEQLQEARRTAQAQQAIALPGVSSVLGRSAKIVRSAMYGWLGLTEPDQPARIDQVPFEGTLDVPEYP
jgi:hypothetical protein